MTMGTHPLADLQVVCDAVGISRVADLTGLDCIGIPVWQAIRPLSKNLSVSQGKGLTAAEAIAGAVMEAVELHAAEMPRVDYVLAVGEVTPTLPYRLAELAGFASEPAPRRKLEWVSGRFLDDGTPTLVPVDAIRLDFTSTGLCWPTFVATSTGLAAANDATAATRHALYEVIERHSVRMWRARSPHARPVAVDSVPPLDHLFDRVRAAGCAVRVYDCGELGVPCAAARLYSPEYLTVFTGSGCDATWTGAAMKAVLEAIQSRMTNVAGARDDIAEIDYLPVGGNAEMPGVDDSWPTAPITARYADAPIGADVQKAISYCLRELRHRRAIVVDLSTPNVPVAVVRVLVPGLVGPR